jgi:hypothetical protein
MNKVAMKLLAGAALLAGAGTAANAVVIPDIVATGTFFSDHCTGGCGDGSATGQPGGFATITATDHNNGTIDISIVLNNGNTFANGGQDVVFGFNLVNNPTITYSNLNASFLANFDVAGTATLVQNAGALAADGFGNFEYGVEGLYKGSNGPTSLSFTISGTGLTIASFAELTNNPPGDTQAFMGLDIASGTQFNAQGAPNTGFVDLSLSLNQTCTNCENPPGTPIPGAVWLFGTVLAGGAGYGRWRKRKQTAKAA